MWCEPADTAPLTIALELAFTFRMILTAEDEAPAPGVLAQMNEVLNKVRPGRKPKDTWLPSIGPRWERRDVLCEITDQQQLREVFDQGLSLEGKIRPIGRKSASAC
jgi:hypothetical protein